MEDVKWLADYRSNLRKQWQNTSQNSKKCNKVGANGVIVDTLLVGENIKTEPQTQENQFSLSFIKMNQEQVNKLTSMVNAMNNKGSNTIHMAGITCFSSILVTRNDWIIYSGALHYITPNADLLVEIEQLSIP